jgi:hypothetical protein
MTEAKPPNLFQRLHRNLIEWNVFVSEDQQPTPNPDLGLLREQRISTRVYIISLTS